MKIRLLIVVFTTLFAFANLSAQTEQGRFVFGGATSFDVVNLIEEEVTTLTLKPELGYFVYDNFSIGLTGLIVADASEINNFDGSLLSEFKYYFLQDKFRPFVKLNAGYRKTSIYERSVSSSSFSTIHGLAIGSGIGGAYFLNDNISIDFSLQYLYSDMKRKGQVPPQFRTDYSVKQTNINVFVGLSFYL